MRFCFGFCYCFCAHGQLVVWFYEHCLQLSLFSFMAFGVVACGYCAVVCVMLMLLVQCVYPGSNMHLGSLAVKVMLFSRTLGLLSPSSPGAVSLGEAWMFWGSFLREFLDAELINNMICQSGLYTYTSSGQDHVVSHSNRWL
jgi:hypothetical protein